ncbi:MAG: Signal recognition particle protein [Chlamydiales bacterium]|nr:Signal recognition particle protein [Chlamydiales bacterium]
MFGSLTDKLTGVFSSLAGKKKLSEGNISDAVREVRLALLDADVNYGVTKKFINSVKEKALGEEVIKSVSPGQQFVKVIHEELVALMGGGEAVLHLQQKPAVVMLCGLQGAGKTTHAAKLAKYLSKPEHRKKILLVACDLQRPAAIEQLKTLGAQIDVDVFSVEGEKKPVKVAKKALKAAKEGGYDVVILDTAGRLHIDDALMKELQEIKAVTTPHEILFVANAATGQDAVTTASEFNARLSVTGTILTMLDGDTRAGAAISIHAVTGKPLKFEGIGEKLDDLQLFNAKSMADRILGMGDTINLVKKAKEHMSDEEAQQLEEKMRTASFTYKDYLKQMQAVRKMGSFKGLMKMIPGASKIPDLDGSEKEFFKIEAMILSMTTKERLEKDELSMSRMKRIARGSGTTVQDINKLKKSFKKSKQFFKNAPNRKMMEKFMDKAPF